MLCFTVKEHFALSSLLEGLHLMWIARHVPPFRTGTSYAADFNPSQPAFAVGFESAFCIKGGTAYHKLNELDAEMMMAALSRWMRLYHQSYMPNPVANSTGFSNSSNPNGSASAAAGVGGDNGKATPSFGVGLTARPRVPSIGPSNDRFQLHFRFHVIQLSTLFNAHHVVHALVSTCADVGEATGSRSANGSKSSSAASVPLHPSRPAFKPRFHCFAKVALTPRCVLTGINGCNDGPQFMPVP